MLGDIIFVFLTVHSERPLLKELQNVVTPYYAASWKEIGLQLGIAQGMLQTIEINFQTDAARCCAEMFTKWLDTDVTASWGKLIQVVYSPAIINTFNKSHIKLEESEAVKKLGSKLKDRHIVTRYKSPEEEDWFSEPEHFTSVALIHQKKHKTKRDIIEFANMHLKGDFIKSGIVTTNIADIFALAECTGRPYILLIEGAPGIGKTVLSKEIVFQWANENLLKNEKLVFLLYFRDPKIRKINNFESLIEYISYSQISKSIEQYIGSVSGKGITLVFDGYDEYPDMLREDSYLSDVINRKIFELQSCNIIITSRPSASGCLHNKVDLRVEILGFTKEHRKSYIVHALKNNPNAIQDLLEYLESNYSVDAYCHVPLSMAILVFLFKELDYNKNELPTTQTAINYKFVRIIIRRFIKKFQKEPLTISKFSEVPKPYKQILLEISKLAFKALQEDNIVFSANEIRTLCPSLLKDSKYRNGLDLLKAVEFFNLEENADELSFNFLHFSVQELLAAYHISLMSEYNQIELLKETFWNSRYFNTWIMYVALTKDQPFPFRHFLSGNWLRLSTRFHLWWSGKAYIGISNNMKESKIKRLQLFQCFTEAGNDDMCHYIGNLLQDGTIDLSGQTLSAVEMYTLSLFLARSVQRHWRLLDLSNCYLDDENFERFYKSYASLMKSTVYINTINLSSNVFTKASASQIANLALNFNVNNLVFAANEIQDIGIDRATFFVALLEHSNLVHSRFIEIQDENQVNLVLYKKVLYKSNLSELFVICYCSIETYKDVCIYIEKNSSFFEKLITTNNASMFKTMLYNLINKLISFSTNFKLFVNTSNLTNEEIDSIINSLASNFLIAVRIGDSCLPLHLCSISNEVKDYNEMIRGLNDNNLGTILFHGKVSIKAIHSKFCLFFGKNNLNQIYLNGIILNNSLISNVLPKCTSFSSLQLVNCCVHGVSLYNLSVKLAQVLHNTKVLKHLNLCGCRLKTELMKIILEALKQVVSVITISLSNNDLGNGVFNVLVSVITCNRRLKSIELSNCNLQEAAVMSITKALENCENLQSLDFSNNSITDDVAVGVAMLIEKCQSIQDLRLQNCRLQYTGIQKITEVMGKKTFLQCIDLSDNAINATSITSVIVHNKNLQKLIFSNCKLQNAGLQQLFQATAKITSLVHLDLSKNLLTDVTVDSFALMIHQNVSLEYLNISGCCDKAKDFEKVTHSLVTLKSLTHLDLSCNVIDTTCADNITVLITNNVFLKHLNLSKCKIQEFAFLRFIIALQHLQYLYLNSTIVCYEEAEGIAKFIYGSSFLENVDFSNCNLTEKGMKIILSSLRNHTSLKRFDISSNTITNHVVNDIVDVIDNNAQLTHLNLSDTNIQEYGILKIFKAAQRINTLKCIKMCNCTISDQAAKDIADAISVNCMMEELVFANNLFREKGIALIFNVLKKAHTLKSLTIASNFVNTKYVTTKVIEIASSNHITYFNLSNCNLHKNSRLSILNTLISQAPNLQHIDLSGNNLCGTAETMAQLISASYYLQHVNLANTLMQDEEVMMIIKAMQNINSLLCVDLTSYNINDELAVELQNTINKNAAVISFQFSKLFLKENEVTVTTLSKSIFSVVIGLQEISFHFHDFKNDQVDAVTTLTSNSPYLKYFHLENYTMLEINIDNIVIALGKITTLEYFCLVNVAISDKVDNGIATIVDNNILLKHFKLAECKLTEELTKFIQLFNMTQLSYLVLSKLDNIVSHNTGQLIGPICDSLIHLHLSKVHLNKSKLSLLSLPSLTELQYLDLSHNPLTNESADILSSVIYNNNGLKYLDLCDCKLQSEGIRVIANSLQAISVVYLNMSLNTIDIDTFNNDVMPALLPSLKIIEHLYFPYCELKQREIDAVVDFISDALHLNFIDFGPDSISKNIISDFKNIIFVCKRNKQICFSKEGLEKVNFNNGEIENLYHSLHYLNINNVIVNNEVVSALIAKSPELNHLEMAGCEWNCTMTEIFCLLRECTDLQVLDLHNCHKLKSKSSTKNISVTTESPTLLKLNYLDLNNNFIDDEAVNCLVALITTNVGLEYLNLYNCKLSSFGIQSISNALKVSSSLKFLDIRFNGNNKSLVDDQVIVLLSNKRNLEQLKLFDLILDKRNFCQVQSHLLVIKDLECISICDCFFTDKDVNNLISLIVNNPTLHELCLVDCEMSMKSKIKFSCIATAIYMQILNFDKITVTNPMNENIKHSLNSNTLLQYKFSLTDNDVVAVMTVNGNLGELIMFKLIVNQDNLKVLSTNTVKIRYLKVFYIQNCTFTDHYTHYVASLITINAATIQSFSLTSCRMSIKQKMIITKALCKLNIIFLQHLDIRDILFIDDVKHERNNITETSCKLTDDIVRAVSLPKYTLLLHNNHLKVILNAATDLVVNTIAALIANRKYVTSLSLRNCILNNNQLKIIFDAMQEFSSLTFVDININEINDEYITDVATLIENNRQMKEFANVCKLTLTQNMIQNFSSILVKFRGIHHLNIVGCTFDVKDWDILKQLIAYNLSINIMTIFHCQLYNGISEIINSCTHLSHLDLDNVNIARSNKLGIPAIWLPAFLELKTVRLTSVNFTDQVGKDALTIVNGSEIEHFVMMKCDGCGSSKLWKVFSGCENLLHFDLSYSRISGEIVAYMLTYIKKVTHIIMDSCDFDKKGFFLIVNQLHQFHNIVHINLNNNKNVCYYGSEIASVIRRSINLNHIEMAACNFDEDGIVKICNSIGACFRTWYINLSHNKIIGKAVDAVVAMLRLKIIVCINLRNCGIKCAGSRDIIMALGKIISLRFFNLSLNEMTEDSLVHITTMINNNKNIEVLCLPDYKCISTSDITKATLSPNGIIRCFLDTFESSEPLKHIEFGSTYINDDLANDVKALRTKYNSLILLKFSELTVTHKGFKQLGNSILIMEGLNSINITGVHFTDSDANNLATLIINNKLIGLFNISGCVIPEKEMNTIFEAMINLTSLTLLNLKNIVISDTVEDKVLDVIANNTSLEYLEVTGCEMNMAKLSKVTACSSFSNLKVVS